MGEMEVPADALYGASTQRAVLNFPISGTPMPRRFLRALARRILRLPTVEEIESELLSALGRLTLTRG